MACRSTGGAVSVRPAILSSPVERTQCAQVPEPDRLQGHEGTFGDGASTVLCDTLHVVWGPVRQERCAGFI